MDKPTKRLPRPRARRNPPKTTCKVSCRRGSVGLGPNLALAILDVSELGIRLRVREALDPRQEIEVGLEGLGHACPLRVPAQVVWCVAMADGFYCIGARFQSRLTYHDLQKLARI
jgi:hypothetical protein